MSGGSLSELCLAAPDCLSTGLLGLKDCVLKADPLGAASMCQSKLALGAEAMFAVVAKKTLGF